MPSKIKTQVIDRSFSSNYLKKAKELLAASKDCFSKSEWNAATICAVHGCISGNDALSVFFLGKRHCGEHHSDAVSLMRTIRPDDERFKKNALRLSRIINIKNMAEYEERLVFRSEAEKALQDCVRFIEFAEELLSQN